MKKTLTILSTFLTTIFLGLTFATSAANAAELSDAAKKGQDIVFDRKKGNCFACHAMAGSKLPPGNIGPPLIAMEQRFMDKSKLRAQIWDATVINPESVMPPFGRHEILTEKEIDQVVEFIHSL
ncbi:MAG: sulfur oxidation c-type cytochrome SoxX [Nitrosopumilus sp.]|nr:sulfur oxidation c-type cytochrome SoxX [Nitrosopumilus sp.]